jgi:predicted lysophospholipase L1 biosynthesis ABC-type transport system permease subunit
MRKRLSWRLSMNGPLPTTTRNRWPIGAWLIYTALFVVGLCVMAFLGTLAFLIGALVFGPVWAFILYACWQVHNGRWEMGDPD